MSGWHSLAYPRGTRRKFTYTSTEGLSKLPTTPFQSTPWIFPPCCYANLYPYPTAAFPCKGIPFHRTLDLIFSFALPSVIVLPPINAMSYLSHWCVLVGSLSKPTFSLFNTWYYTWCWTCTVFSFGFNRYPPKTQWRKQTLSGDVCMCQRLGEGTLRSGTL